MCVLSAPGVTRIEFFAETGDLFARRHSLNDWWRDFIVLDPWLWRDNLGENGAAIRMRSGSRTRS
jgi:hypothetical protein